MNYFVEKFLENEEHKSLLDNYLINPTDEKRESLQQQFNDFYMQIKLIAYFSKSVPFLAQNFDKLNRQRNQKALLTLSDLNGSDGLESIPDETSLHADVSFDIEAVEQYFEHQELYDGISKLTIRQKQLIYFFFIKELTDKEISKALNVSVQTINKQRNAILKKLKRRIS